MRKDSIEIGHETQIVASVIRYVFQHKVYSFPHNILYANGPSKLRAYSIENLWFFLDGVQNLDQSRIRSLNSLTSTDSWLA